VDGGGALRGQGRRHHDDTSWELVLLDRPVRAELEPAHGDQRRRVGVHGEGAARSDTDDVVHMVAAERSASALGEGAVLDGAQRPGLLEHDAEATAKAPEASPWSCQPVSVPLRPGDEPDVQPRIAGEAGPGAFGAVVGQQGRQVGV
jgi:hypothetical protein